MAPRRREHGKLANWENNLILEPTGSTTLARKREGSNPFSSNVVEPAGFFWVGHMEEKLLLTEPEAAKLLSLSTKTLARLRNAGKLHFIRIGNAIRYEVEALISLIQDSKVTA